jgi:hypothetical protein
MPEIEGCSRLLGYRATVEVVLKNKGVQTIDVGVFGVDAEDAKRRVTVDYVLKNVSDDWSIRNVYVTEMITDLLFSGADAQK